MKSLREFKKKNEILVCVDSDGCVMDTMNVKHIECFGPCMVEEWGLHEWKDSVLTRWNDINLYTVTRGINRFKALAMALAEIDGRYKKIDGIEAFIHWTETSDELSNNAIKEKISGGSESVIFSKALDWSIAVNEKISKLSDDKKVPFPMAKEALAFAHEKADIAIVSSANIDAVHEEWSKHGFLEYVDIVLSQSDGSKSCCIGKLLKKGYDRSKVLMCGDAVGDLLAAEENIIHFYPILVRKEKDCWEEFINTAFGKLEDGSYSSIYQAKKKHEFLKNLGEN